VGRNVFFSANDGEHGQELWVSDGTADGILPLADIAPGINGSNPLNLTPVGSLLFFTANDTTHGRELWVSDGTAEGTQLVADINPGSMGSAPNHLIGFDNRLFFSANDGAKGVELWTSDGTLDGTELVGDINPGAGSSFPTGFTVVDQSLYFTANDGDRGTELWHIEGLPLTSEPDNSAVPEIVFEDFSNPANLVFNGDATPLGDRIRLTPSQKSQVGSVFYQEGFSIDANTSFETDFEFHIDNGQKKAGADGFVWVIQSSSAGSGAIGRGGGQLGYGGMAQSVGIEFDTYGGKYNPHDRGNSNHISLLRDGNVRAPLATATPEFDLNSGERAHAWITYDGLADQLEVFVSQTPQRPEQALLSANIALDSLLEDIAYVGFTAATGGRVDNHDILNWQMSWADPVGNNLISNSAI
jgi:ELWxxDGT repeat protein